MPTILWERHEDAWTLHLRSGGEYQLPLSLGPFDVVLCTDELGAPAWIKVYDDPEDPAAAANDVDPGWAQSGDVVEFRLRRASRPEDAGVSSVTVRGPSGDVALYVGWEELPYKRLCALGVSGNLVDSGTYSPEL